jgi:pimeloyl-ACP methyl ester carboxylesterase
MPTVHDRRTRRLAILVAPAAISALLLASLVSSADGAGANATATSAIRAGAVVAGHPSHHSPGRKPTVVLVHGAFADASGWAGVITRLQRDGYPVLAPANPLRGLSSDAAYLRTVLDSISGPIVLVGHSYGGAVITNAATDDPDVQALVYIAAFALAQGENVAQASALAGGSNDLLSHIVLRPFGTGANDQDAYIDPAFFRQTFAQDVDRRTTDVMALSQRPAALATLGEPSGPPAWADIPSWYLVAHDDNTIPPVSERAMARRAGSHTVEIRSSHVAMISHPATVARLVERAAHDS